MVWRAHFGPITRGTRRSRYRRARIRWLREHGTLHVPDVQAQNDFPMWVPSAAFVPLLVVPLRQQGELIGSLDARRTEVRPFTPAQTN